MPVPAAFRDRLRLLVIASPMFIAAMAELVVEEYNEPKRRSAAA